MSISCPNTSNTTVITTAVTNNVITEIFKIIEKITLDNSTAVCQGNVVNSQVIKFNNIHTTGLCNLHFNNISTETTFDQVVKCIDNNAKPHEELINNVNTLARHYSPNINTNDSKYVNVRTNLVNNINFVNISSCIATMINSQLMEFSNLTFHCDEEIDIYFENLKQVIVATQVVKCVTQNENAVKSICNLVNYINESKISESETSTIITTLPGLQTGEIIGIAIGSVFGVILVICLIIWANRRRKNATVANRP